MRGLHRKNEVVAIDTIVHVLIVMYQEEIDRQKGTSAADGHEEGVPDLS